MRDLTKNLSTEPGQPMDVSSDASRRRRVLCRLHRLAGPDHPSDDLMTELMFTEFEDETGTTCRLTRDEVLIYVSVVATAGNETTNRLIGWTGKVLAEHPEQLSVLVEDRALCPQRRRRQAAALRTTHTPRGSLRDAVTSSCTARPVPAGSAMICLSGSANRDDPASTRMPTPVRHPPRGTASTSRSATASTTASARAWRALEGRVALDEVLQRFPEWEVDYETPLGRAPTSTVRGWESLPVFPPHGVISGPAAGRRRDAGSCRRRRTRTRSWC